jgi:hypothetical protein
MQENVGRVTEKKEHTAGSLEQITDIILLTQTRNNKAATTLVY